jgi:hypothetical protein
MKRRQQVVAQNWRIGGCTRHIVDRALRHPKRYCPIGRRQPPGQTAGGIGNTGGMGRPINWGSPERQMLEAGQTVCDPGRYLSGGYLTLMGIWCCDRLTMRYGRQGTTCTV